MNWDRDIMYWTANPQHKLIFGEVYKTDTTRDKYRSSSFMWGLALIFNIESEIYEWRLDEKIEYVSKNIWKDNEKDFKEKMAQWGPIMDKINGGDTPAMRQLKQWNRIMDEKNNFIEGLKYDKTTWKMVEEMLASNGKLFAEYERIQQALMKESLTSDKTIGGSMESLLEKKVI